MGDFWGNDGLPDMAVGTFWKANTKNGVPKSFGGLLKNKGPAGNPTFELAHADAGAFYTEQFQPCDAGQQNGVRSANWDGDADLDLVASTTDGHGPVLPQRRQQPVSDLRPRSEPDGRRGKP